MSAGELGPDGVTRYSHPYGPADDIAKGSEIPCEAGNWRQGGYACTRIAGHDGDHQAAGMTRKMLASWSRE